MSEWIEEGKQAPDFELQTDRGEPLRLSAQRGKPVVLYFYPQDDTPGCTKEACAFRDRRPELAERGALVLGVSPDDVRSHAAFRDKYSLDFPLLADPDHEVAETYGAWREKNNYGKTYMGVQRSTFLIDGDGVVRKVWKKVDVREHDQQVIDALDAVARA
jgi:thioredoxin-dependent peroxiredoxin